MKYIPIFIVVIFLSSCANQLQLGLDAYDQGNYDVAAGYWNPLAKNGNQYAEYNLGLLWEFGLGSTPKNPNEASHWYLRAAQRGYAPAMVRLALIQKASGYNDAALSWLNLAARWGNQDAINSLHTWGHTIPQPDLLLAKNQREAAVIQQSSEALNHAAYLLGCALAGGYCSGSPSSYSTPPTSTQSSIKRSELVTSRSKNTRSTGPKSSSSGKKCDSDYSCGFGKTCVKAPLEFDGVCMNTVNQFGTKKLNIPNPESIGPNLNTSGECDFDTDCPIGFRCDRKLKACVN